MLLLINSFNFGKQTLFKQFLSKTISPLQSKSLFGNSKNQTSSVQQVDYLSQKYDSTKSAQRYYNEVKKAGVIEQIFEKSISENILDDFMAEKYGYSHSNYSQSQLTALVCGPISDVNSRQSKRMFGEFCALVAESQNRSMEDVVDIAGAFEVILEALLILDDLQDNTIYRRNQPAIHIKHGHSSTISSGNLVMFKGLQYLVSQDKYSEIQKIKFMTIYLDDFVSLHLGQGTEIAWRNQTLNEKIPTEQDFLKMVVNKTSTFFTLLTRFLCISLDLNKNVEQGFLNFALHLGIAFQIENDVSNLENKNYYEYKGMVGEDIYDGKLTLIVIHCLQNLQDPDQKTDFWNILKSKTKDQNLINKAISYMKSTGSIEYAKQVSINYLNDAYKSLDFLEDGEAKNKLKHYAHNVIYEYC